MEIPKLWDIELKWEKYLHCTLSLQENDRNGDEIVLNDLIITYWLQMLYKLSGRYFNAVKSTFSQGSNLAVFTIHLIARI